MANIKTNEFKNGLKIILDQDPYNILNVEHVQPGKGQAFVRVNCRNLLTNRVLERTFKSGESIETAEVIELELQYLYNDGEFWHFMDSSTYEQYQAEKKSVINSQQWLVEQDQCIVLLWDNKIISVTPPNFVIMSVLETDPGLKGDTASGGTKPAKLEGGATVLVPLFIDQGEKIKIDTRDGTYSSRIKE